eukprot:TRINITY_DN4558_c0_g1_i1.p1 TRINITY_DN4558_c0_g1~~TRINITY_DN4558_c0_g1_i1.p1  ORF type:complete len:604 (+),score=202.83 TRINITY_DN4558_c0_g1_i1:53-1864(+)
MNDNHFNLKSVSNLSNSSTNLLQFSNPSQISSSSNSNLSTPNASNNANNSGNHASNSGSNPSGKNGNNLTIGSESYYRNQAEKLDKENKQLKSKMDTIERENRELKKSLYDLSFRFDHLASQLSKPPKPFSLDHLDSSVVSNQSSSSSLSSTASNADSSSSSHSFASNSIESNANVSSGNLNANSSSQNSNNPNFVSSASNSSQEGGNVASNASGMNSASNSAQNNLTGSSNRNVQHSTGSIRKVADGKHFYCKQTLKGHNGAIYSVAFAPCGKFLASGSFDKTARIWDASTGQETICFQDHQLSICDLSWSYDSTLLLTGSFDHTAKIWNLETSKLSSSHEVSGFAQSVVFDSQDYNIFFVGCTHKKIHLFDRRQTENSMVFENDAMVTGLYIYRDGFYVLSSDSHGCLKLWDKRKGAQLSSISISTDDKKVPISNIHVSKAVRTDEEGKYLGVNCYDNVLRVYDRGANSTSIATQPSVTKLELTHSVLGYKNKNWPITSSFFVGKNYQLFGSHNRSGSDNEEENNEESSEDEKNSEHSFLLATGSADPFAYVYNISGQKGNYSLMQKLEGHTDRVYGVHFHPFDPILASCSSDGTVKLWSN